MKRIAFFILLFAISSCTTYSDKELKGFDTDIQSYIDSTGVSMERTEDGLYYKIIKEGEGDRLIGYNDQVTFSYKASFFKGKTFQIIGKEDPLKYKVNQLILGWQDALMLLKEGGEIHIIIPPQLAYADNKTGLIPANTIIMYDLTVLKVE